MSRTFIKLSLISFVTYLLFIQPAIAVKIVRLELEYGSDFIATGGFDIPKTKVTLDLELFDDEAPATVTNYLNYVNSGRYNQTFFNRSIKDFVIQTGGVTNITNDPDNDALGESFGVVQKFDQVVNEPGLSNIRGTIAMARRAGQVDSASSEWFINLNDSNTFLDTVDEGEGFTVFGSVIDNGMEIADQIASFPVTDISFLFGSSYTDLPIVDNNPSAGEIITSRNIVMVTNVSEVNRPIVRFTPAFSNFGFESTGSTAAGKLISVVLRNTGNEVLDIGPFSANSLELPFSLESEDCSNTSLSPVSSSPESSCTVSLKFLPSSSSIFNDSLKVDYTSQINGESFSVKYPLLGEGALGPPVIAIVDTFDVGTSQVNGFSTSKDIVVGNIGQASLQINSISGLGLTGFSQTNDCIGASILIAPSETCNITVTFTTSDFDSKMATLIVESDDLANEVVNIALIGRGESDADGISSLIESNSPNAGDNNFDGILDSVQNKVASFVGTGGDYVSLVVDNNIVVSNISVVSTDQLVELPSNVEFKYGDIGFQIDVVEPGARATVGIILPADSPDSPTELTAYYFFGETEDNTTPHWYPYQAINVLANAVISDPAGNQSKRDAIKLFVQDGGLGDFDQVVNGRIVIAHGAPAYSIRASDSGSSALNILFLCLYTLIALLLKRMRSL